MPLVRSSRVPHQAMRSPGGGGGGGGGGSGGAAAATATRLKAPGLGRFQPTTAQGQFMHSEQSLGRRRRLKLEKFGKERKGIPHGKAVSLISKKPAEKKSL